VKKTGAKKVIQSGKNDTVFIYLSGHGGAGLFKFPNSTLYAHELIDTVTAMSKEGKFSKMVIYIDSCSSGSMLDQLKDSNVYAVSSCRPDERSYGFFMDTRLNACLSDAFTAYWLKHTETRKLTTTSFRDQFSYLNKKVSESARRAQVSQTPCNYGDMNISNVMLSELLGESPAPVTRAEPVPPTDFTVSETLISQRDDLIQKRKTMDDALKKIEKRLKGQQTLREKPKVTRTYLLKVVAEHFKNNLFNW
ncbi:legumain-like, partial [Tachysurus ichikawai]